MWQQQSCQSSVLYMCMYFRSIIALKRENKRTCQSLFRGVIQCTIFCAIRAHRFIKRAPGGSSMRSPNNIYSNNLIKWIISVSSILKCGVSSETLLHAVRGIKTKMPLMDSLDSHIAYPLIGRIAAFLYTTYLCHTYLLPRLRYSSDITSDINTLLTIVT